MVVYAVIGVVEEWWAGCGIAAVRKPNLPSRLGRTSCYHYTASSTRSIIKLQIMSEVRLRLGTYHMSSLEMCAF